MSLALARYLLALLALCRTPLLAADTNEFLIEHLAAAEKSRQKQDVVDEIRERTAAGPMSTGLTDRLIAELMSDETLRPPQARKFHQLQ